MQTGHDRDHHNQNDRDGEVGQNFSDHDLAASQRGDQQLVKRSRFTLTRNGARHQRDGQQLQNKTDDARHHVIDEARFWV